MTTSTSTAHVLYRIFDAVDALLYVGITMRPVERLHDHAHREWWQEAVTIRLQSFASREQLREAERAAILSESPRYNIVLNGLPRRRWYSIEQVAEQVCGDTTWPKIKWLHRQIKNGRLTGVKRKGVWRFTDADVDALLDACSNMPKSVAS